MSAPQSQSAPEPQLFHEWAFEAIGTKWWIGVYQHVPADRLQTAQQAITNAIEQFDQSFSRFRADSWVTQVSQQAVDYPLPPHAAELLALYRQLYDVSNGLVTPLIGGLLSDAGYDATYNFQPGELHQVPAWDDVMSVTDGVLHTTQPLLLDFGAAGKGFLVDIVTELLQEQGITAFCVDGSGDLRLNGVQAPLRVGMENPHNPEQVVGVISLQNRALCASAPQRRQWLGYHHIMNPYERASTQGIAAVWTLADSCALADGLTTALFFVEPGKLAQHFTFDYAVLYDDSSWVQSTTLPAELFTAG